MKRLLSLMVLGFVVATTAGCGKTDEEKAKEKVEELSAQHDATVNWLRNAGTPNATWSDDRLDKYEAMINRLDRLERELKAMSGKNGVIVYGGDNTAFIKDKRQLIASIRAQRRGNGNGGQVNAQAVDRLKVLSERNYKIAEELESLGEPDLTWTDSKTKRAIRLAEEGIANCDEMTRIIDKRPDLPNRAARKEEINQLRESFSIMKDFYTRLLNGIEDENAA